MFDDRWRELKFDSPQPQHTTLCRVGWEARNLPLVRRKLSFCAHAQSVVVNDGGWGVDHLRGFLKENILYLVISPL